MTKLLSVIAFEKITKNLNENYIATKEFTEV